MPSLTLAIPQELKEKMQQFPEINWSEVARQAIIEKTKRLERMNQLLQNSTLNETEVLEFGNSIKKQVFQKHQGSLSWNSLWMPTFSSPLF